MYAVFTTSQVAKIVGVAPRTVAKWFDKGDIQGYRIPGSQDRRIPRKALYTFIRKNQLEHVHLPGDPRVANVLLVSRDQSLITRLASCFTVGHGVQLVLAADTFQAGYNFAATRPQCLLVHVQAPGDIDQVLSFCNLMVQRNVNVATLILMDAEWKVSDDFPYEIVRLPFDPVLLRERVHTRTQREP